MKLAFIGTANWDIYANDDGQLSAIAKPGNSAGSSHFGDRDHIKRLMDQGYFTGTATEHGLELMHGLHTSFLPNGGKYLSFYAIT